MAQDSKIYEAVCAQQGHDLFVLNDVVSGGRQALCKKCGAEIGIGVTRTA